DPPRTLRHDRCTPSVVDMTDLRIGICRSWQAPRRNLTRRNLPCRACLMLRCVSKHSIGADTETQKGRHSIRSEQLSVHEQYSWKSPICQSQSALLLCALPLQVS